MFAVLAILLTFALSAHAIVDVSGEDSFPGWLGAAVTRKPSPPTTSTIDMSRVIQLSAWKPRAYLYKGFLSEEECDHLMRKASPKLQRSGVADYNSGKSLVSEVRTSSGTFISKGEDQVMKRIEERISEWTFLPIANQESLQVLRYTHGQKYEPHFDYFHDAVNRQRGGHRYATVLMYLNTPELGGETVFPSTEDSTPKDETWTECARGRLAVKPQKGDALLFFSMHPDGTPDESSMHYACPVVRGEKWSAPMWIHVADFNKPYKAPGDESLDTQAVVADASGCTDTNGLCSIWASHGECKKNPGYMTRACPKSCKSC